MTRQLTLLLFLSGLLACGSRKEPAPSSTDSTARKDSTLRLSAAFVTFKEAFTTTPPGPTDEGHELSIVQIKSWMKDGFDTSWVHSASPDTLIENRAGYFFIVKGHCPAGGDCGEYFLMAFDRNGNFLKGENIGRLVAELNDIEDMSYKMKGDSVLLTFQVDTQLEDDDDKDTTASKPKTTTEQTHRINLLTYTREK